LIVDTREEREVSGEGDLAGGERGVEDGIFAEGGVNWESLSITKDMAGFSRAV
jgi:hypothetical protein